MRLSLLLLLGLSLTAYSQVYKVVKKDGTVIYTDSPVEGSEEVTFKGSTQNVAKPLAVVKPAPPVEEKKKINYSVSITSPENEATVRNNSGDITITATKEPKQSPAQFKLVFDGQDAQLSSNGTFTLTGINRGAHQFQVLLIDNKGKTLASSETRTLYLHRASVFINNINRQ